ncbi:cupin [Rhodococcus rhodnii]|uniref:JmjC domain-containing protein n=2 Tax=Rhodococcus rhodnii TaxID=38312 RepID=R7WLC0_9NOCA|nr:cupin domain-containing protein [Rhodococcus rhodnii]EOM76085.1 hypothetical protein Rrhod_2614 [Rhodococcus rhodnii LMG 5362]TXG91478.1 cupin [Rhodococcus rhodnii]
MIERCVAPSPERFAREHWGRRPLHSPAAELPRDFTDLLSPQAVDELVAERGVRTPFLRMAREGRLVDRACFTRTGGFGAEMADQIDSSGVLAQFASGATIVLQGLHRLWPPIIAFVGGLAVELGHPVQTNAYITPPDNRGFDPHYDVHDVFVLQVSGRKHWLVHDPVHPDPLADQPWTDHRAAVEARAAEPAAIDAVLAPGDALYLPRGWIHSARSLGETSVHLTVGVSAFTQLDVVRALLTALGDRAELRASLPMGLDTADPVALEPIVRDVAQTMGKLLHEQTEGIDRPDGVVASGSASLAARFVDLTRPEPVRPLATVDAIAALGPDTAVRVRAGLHPRVERRGDRTTLRLPTATLSLPVSCDDAVRAVMSGETLTPAALPGLDEHDALVLIRRLLREGVVVTA